MNVTVRPAEVSDCSFLAQVMYDSMLPGTGRGIFDAALEGTGVDPLTFHETLLRAGANNWGQLESFVVLDAPDRPQAGAMGAFLSNMADLRPLTAQGYKLVAEQLPWSQEASRDFWRRYMSMFGPFGNAPQLAQPAEYVLEYVAVHADLRGRGLVGKLLEAHIERARALGLKTVGQTAMFGNDAVLRSLQKLGFREHSRHGPEFYRGAFPGLYRMIKDC